MEVHMFYLAREVGKFGHVIAEKKGNFEMINEFRCGQTWKFWPSPLSFHFTVTLKTEYVNIRDIINKAIKDIIRRNIKFFLRIKKGKIIIHQLEGVIFGVTIALNMKIMVIGIKHCKLNISRKLDSI